VRVTVVCGEHTERVVGTVVGRHHRPHLLEAWGQRFNMQLEDHVALFRYKDVPGMLGRIGTAFGQQGVNIDAAAVGRLPDEDDDHDGGDTGLAVMVVTTDVPVPQSVIDDVVAGEGFDAGRAVALS
jgi:D-3-phosphoglycerate dehydrogenase